RPGKSTAAIRPTSRRVDRTSRLRRGGSGSPARTPRRRAGAAAAGGAGARSDRPVGGSDRAASVGPFSVLFVLRDAVDGIVGVLARLVGELVLHQEGVLPAILIICPQDPDGSEALGAEEQLRRQIGLANLQRDARAAVAGELANELGDHLAADADAAAGRVDG